MKILHWKHTPELEAILAFLKWQTMGGKIELEDNIRVLGETGGKNVPVIYGPHGILIAKGFQELFTYWNKEGLFLC